MSKRWDKILRVLEAIRTGGLSERQEVSEAEALREAQAKAGRKRNRSRYG